MRVRKILWWLGDTIDSILLKFWYTILLHGKPNRIMHRMCFDSLVFGTELGDEHIDYDDFASGVDYLLREKRSKS